MVIRKTLTFTADNAEDLERAVGSLILLEGSKGRIELIAPRVLGICPVPLGPLMAVPLAGQVWAEALAPSGALVTGRNGFGEVCDAWVEWQVPATQGQTATMGLVVAVVAVAVAIGAALVALGWAVSQIRLVIDGIFESLPDAVDELAKNPLVWVGVGLLALALLGPPRRRRRT